MSDTDPRDSLARRRKLLRLPVERRATDHVLSLWREGDDTYKTIDCIKDTYLWDHCFLLVVDNEMHSSVIIDQGERVAKGLAMERRGVAPLRKLHPGLARRIFSLGRRCLTDHAPCFDACEPGQAADIPVSRYRMAVVPLAKTRPRTILPGYDVRNVLGVFTYQ